MNQRSAKTQRKGNKLKRRSNKRRTAKHKSHPLLILAAAALVLLMAVIASFSITNIMERKTYKLLYQSEILACADEFSLDPYLIAAVIHVESSNRPEAVSPKGAIGLMQIMPSTGEWIASKFAMQGLNAESLNDPMTNIRMGCWYLRYLLNKYGGIESTALAAYNAGPGNVDKWLADPLYGNGTTLENIPYAETAAYAKKVQSAKEKYKELYEEQLG